MKQDLIFIGYRHFTSKKGTNCFVLSFITKPVVSSDGKSAYSSNVDIFTDESKFNSFIENNNLLDYCNVSCDVVGDRVRYSI